MCLPRLLYLTLIILMLKIAHAMKYMPIHLEDWEDAAGIQRRDNARLDIFDPARRAEMMYGYPKNEDTIFFGNWTLVAPPDLPIVLLERLASHTKSVDCNAEKGQISLLFRSKIAFRRAWETWNFINHESARHRLLVIANHAGCGPDDGRHPYIVTTIRQDPALLTIYLTSTLVGWNEVAHAYSFHWGETTFQNLSGPRKRSSYEFPYPGSGGGFFNLLQPLQQIWKNLGEIHHKSTNKGNPYIINIGKEKLTFISTQNLLVTCVKCHLKTSVLSTGTIEKDAQDSKPKASTATVSFSNLDAGLVLDFESRSDNVVQDLRKEIELAAGAAGPTGISIGPIQIGLTWKIAAYVKYKIQGATQVRVTMGGGFVGHSALVTADFINIDNQRNVGWDHFKHKPTKGQLRQLSHEMSIETGIMSSLAFGFELPEVATLDMSLDIPMPKIKGTLKSLKAKDGFCPKMKNRDKGFHLTASATAIEIWGTARFQFLAAPMKYQDLPIFKAGEFKFLDQCIPATGSRQAFLEETPGFAVADAGDGGDYVDDSQSAGASIVAENPQDPGTETQSDDTSQDPDTTAKPANQEASASNQGNDVDIAQISSDSNPPNTAEDIQKTDGTDSSDNTSPISVSKAQDDSNQLQPNNILSAADSPPTTEQTNPKPQTPEQTNPNSQTTDQTTPNPPTDPPPTNNPPSSPSDDTIASQPLNTNDLNLSDPPSPALNSRSRKFRRRI